jgi:peptidoglycan/LPS O-acetylase OafA/YrhL
VAHKSELNLYIPSLDGIRAVAVMLVFAAHAGLLYGLNVAPGGFGVTIFFFLSGYLITTLLRLEYERTGTINIRKFYLRRVYRILPPFYLVLLVSLCLAFAGFAPSDLTVGAVAAQLGNVSNYYTIFSGDSHIMPGTGPIWSLAVEEHFYLMYPFVLGRILRRYDYRHAARLMLAACAVVLAWRCVLVYGMHVTEPYTYNATDTRVDSILYGCVMGLVLNPAVRSEIPRLTKLTWMSLLAASSALLAFCFAYRDPAFRETFRYSIQGIALFPLFFCAVNFSQWPVFSWLNWRAVRGLGVISYTFYLIHLISLDQSIRALAGHGAFAIVSASLTATIVFSATTYFVVERRFARLRRRLHR